MRATTRNISACAIRRRCGGRRREAVLDRIGLKPGMSSLDIGCGPGAVMRLMADRVGPQGHVTGIDVDGRLGRLALAELRERGRLPFEFVEGDALKLDASPARRSISASAGWC